MGSNGTVIKKKIKGYRADFTELWVHHQFIDKASTSYSWKCTKYEDSYTRKNRESDSEFIAQFTLNSMIQQSKIYPKYQKIWFRCKKSSSFTKQVKSITKGTFICYKQVNDDIKSNSYSPKRQ